jgi:hypothetical protein
MYEDLKSLACESLEKFPNFRCVKIGISSPILPERVAEIEHMKTVESAFASTGVHVSWAEEFNDPFLYSAIPGGAPGLTVTKVPTCSWK